MLCLVFDHHLHCTFITRDERQRPALQSRGNDGAVSVGKDVLGIVVDIFPAVSTSLQETHQHKTNSDHNTWGSSTALTLSLGWSQCVFVAVK